MGGGVGGRVWDGVGDSGGGGEPRVEGIVKRT